MTPAFLDANIPIYASGRDHPLKDPCLWVLDVLAEHPAAFMTDAEVFQELLHRYMALRLWPEPGLRVFDRFMALMQGRVTPIGIADVRGAAAMASEHARLSARDLIHAAVMARLGVRLIVSADTAFDRLPEVERLDPAAVASWRERVLVGDS